MKTLLTETLKSGTAAVTTICSWVTAELSGQVAGIVKLSE
jgi:hypothetical protein